MTKFEIFSTFFSQQHFFQIISQLILKFQQNRSSFKFRLKTRIRALRSASDFFRENYSKLIKFSYKNKKDVPKRAGPRNGHFKHKIDKKGQKMASRVKFDIKFEFFGQFYPQDQSLRTIGQQEKNRFFFTKRTLRMIDRNTTLGKDLNFS